MFERFVPERKRDTTSRMVGIWSMSPMRYFELSKLYIYIYNTDLKKKYILSNSLTIKALISKMEMNNIIDLKELFELIN